MQNQSSLLKEVVLYFLLHSVRKIKIGSKQVTHHTLHSLMRREAENEGTSYLPHPYTVVYGLL